jgi:hypothetical protein
MRWWVIGLVGWCVIANAQIAKCEMPDGRMVWRNANDCSSGRVRGEVVRVDTPSPVVQPQMTQQQVREQEEREAMMKESAKFKASVERDLKVLTFKK